MLIDCETTDANTRTQEVAKINKSSQEPQTVPDQVASIPFGVFSSRSQGPQAEVDTNEVVLVTEGEKVFGLATAKLYITIIYEEHRACPEDFLNRTGMFSHVIPTYIHGRFNTAKFQSFGISSVHELGSLYYDENKACPSTNVT